MSKNIEMPATGDSKVLSQTPELVENKPATTNPRVVIVGAGFFQYAWAYLTFQRGARLITFESGPALPEVKT